MTDREYLHHVDHTLLKPCATWEQIQELCREAVCYRTASVCVPSCYVRRIRDGFPDIPAICTVIGFPLGYASTEAKTAEVRQAILDGADEVDMVINLTDVKNGDIDSVRREIAILREKSQGRILKVIVETCYLTNEEKIALCQAVTEGGGDYIKTSTGFGTAGATLADVQLFREHIGKNVRIKAAGGIRTLEDLRSYVDAGCDRVGSSAAVGLVREKEMR